MSTSMVGFPRESRISRACIISMAEFKIYSRKLKDQIRFDPEHDSTAINNNFKSGTSIQSTH